MMCNQPAIKMYSFTLDCKNPQELAEFYAALLGWVIPFSTGEYSCVAPPGVAQGGYPCILFQQNPDYLPPKWPAADGEQQQMAHMDFAVHDLEGALAYAIHLGATLAGQQFSADWKVLIDPAGHPFCLCQMPNLFKSPDFALK